MNPADALRWPAATPGRRFDELTGPEIAAALARSPRVILPMGSVEQHGPHLPTGTDFFAATAIALEPWPITSTRWCCRCARWA